MTRSRKGSMLLEVSLSVMLLMVALVAVAQLLAVSARQHQENRWRAVATRAVANVTEHVMALPWEETTTDQLDATALDPATRELLGDATLEVGMTDVTEPREGKRIRVSLKFRNTAGLPVEPVTLVAWKFAPGGDE